MRALSDVPAPFPPDRLALVHGAARWTWGDLDRRSAQWCAWLTSRGVTADDLVAFALPNGPDFIALAFGIYRAGATPAPISWKIKEHGCTAIIAVLPPRPVGGEGPPQGDPQGEASGHFAGLWSACTSGGRPGLPKVIAAGGKRGY